MSSPASVFFTTWERLNILSLDVVAGALAGGVMASVLLDVSPQWAYWVVLPMAVWLIYTIDHMIDGYRAGKNAMHKRRIFHQKNFKALSIAVVVLTIVSGFIAFAFLPTGLIRFGIILGIFASFYLLLILFIGKSSARWLPKELLVAAFYTAGIWVPVMIMSEELSNQAFIVSGLFFLLALEDLLLLSGIEAEADRLEGSISLPLLLGKKRTAIVLNMLSIIISISAAMIILSAENITFIRAGIILLLMQLALSLIHHRSERLRPDNRYRYLSEAAFFLPAFMLI